MEKQIDFTDYLLSQVNIVENGLIINEKYFYEGSLKTFYETLTTDETGRLCYFERSQVKVIDSDIRM